MSYDPEALRMALLKAALPHIPFDGWGETALKHAARDLNVEEALALAAFPNGAIGMIDLHQQIADQDMLAALETHDLKKMRVRDRVALAVRLRLEPYNDHRDIVRAGIAVLPVPPHKMLQTSPHPLTAFQATYRTVDAIWRAAGDTSTDLNFYTKRALLAGVYIATLIYWLEDKSDGCTDTWDFLRRRIDDVMKLPGTLKKLGASPKAWVDATRQACRNLGDRINRPRYP